MSAVLTDILREISRWVLNLQQLNVQFVKTMQLEVTAFQPLPLRAKVSTQPTIESKGLMPNESDSIPEIAEVEKPFRDGTVDK